MNENILILVIGLIFLIVIGINLNNDIEEIKESKEIALEDSRDYKSPLDPYILKEDVKIKPKRKYKQRESVKRQLEAKE